jgi:hypothetical protein
MFNTSGLKLDFSTCGGNRTYFLPHEKAFLTVSRSIIGLLTILSILTNIAVIRIFLSVKYGRVTDAKLLYTNISLSDLVFLITCVFQGRNLPTKHFL